jgi:hypothetical protein
MKQAEDADPPDGRRFQQHRRGSAEPVDMPCPVSAVAEHRAAQARPQIASQIFHMLGIGGPSC